jgi:hypothetical protein
MDDDGGPTEVDMAEVAREPEETWEVVDDLPEVAAPRSGTRPRGRVARAADRITGMDLERIGGALGQAVLPAVDRLVEVRYAAAQTSVRQLRARNPHWHPDRVVADLIATARRELAMVGAATGGTAAAPGVGTVTAIGASTADVAWTVSRIGELIMAIGIARGHTTDSIEERRTWVLAVLSMTTGAAKGLKGVAAEVGARGGARIVRSIPMSVIARINRALGRRLVVKWGAQQGVVRLGRLVPFGIGAAIGAAGNAALVQVVGRHADEFFDVGV